MGQTDIVLSSLKTSIHKLNMADSVRWDMISIRSRELARSSSLIIEAV